MTEREVFSALWTAFNRIDEDLHAWDSSSLYGQDLIFPLLLLHRLDCLLAPTKPEVLELEQGSSAGADVPELLRRASRLDFFRLFICLRPRRSSDQIPAGLDGDLA